MTKTHQLPDWVQVGKSFRTYYGPDNINNLKYHIRGIVDGQAVVRYRRKSRQRWHYDVLDDIWFDVFGKHIQR